MTSTTDPFADFFARRWRWRPFFIIAVLGAAAYVPTLNVGFLWDDHVIIENNPYLREWSWTNVKHDFTSDNTQGTGDNYYRPFQAFGHRIDYSLMGGAPWWYHFTNICVHIANACLLFILIWRIGFPPWAALMTACFFVVHPVGVEQFLVASGRTTLLGFFFSLTTLLLMLQPGLLPALLGLLTFALALLTKESSVIVPALLGLVFYYVRVPLKRLWVLIPMGFMTLGYLALREHAVHAVLGPLDPSLFCLFIFEAFPRVLTHYVLLLLWPWNLHSHHLIPHLSRAWPILLLGWVGLSATLIWKKHRTGVFCLGWFLAGLLPTIPVMIRGGFMLDHWGYVIAPAVLLPLGLLLSAMWSAPRGKLRSAAAFIFFGMIVLLSLLVHLNVALRGTDEKIYRWALRFTTSTPVKFNLGVLLLQTGRPQEAIKYLEEVRSNYPEDPEAARATALAYWKLRHYKAAITLLESFSKAYPNNPAIDTTLNGMRDRLKNGRTD